MHVDNTCVLGVWCHVQDRKTNLFMRRVYYYVKGAYYLESAWCVD